MRKAQTKTQYDIKTHNQNCSTFTWTLFICVEPKEEEAAWEKNNQGPLSNYFPII